MVSGLFLKKPLRDRNLGSYGLRRGTKILNFFFLISKEKYIKMKEETPN